MAAETQVTDWEFLKTGTIDIPDVRLANASASGGSSLTFDSDLEDESGNQITKACILGFEVGGKTMEVYIAAGGFTSKTAATITTRPLLRGGLDITTADSSDFDLPATTPVKFTVSALQAEQQRAFTQGEIASGANNLVIGDGTASNMTLSVKDNVSTKGLVRRNNSTGLAQYSNDGTTFINFDTAPPANVTTRITTAASANAGELYQDSADNNSLVFKDNGGTSVKLYDDTLQLIPQASVEVWKDVTADATEINQLDGTTNIAESDTFFGATDITGAQAETLSNGSDADALHTHPTLVVVTNAGQTTRAAATASSTEVIAHGLTFTPKKILFFAKAATTALSDGCTDDDMDNFCTYQIQAGSGANDATKCIRGEDNGGNKQEAAVSAWDATNFTLTWTKTGTGSTTQVTWIASS